VSTHSGPARSVSVPKCQRRQDRNHGPSTFPVQTLLSTTPYGGKTPLGPSVSLSPREPSPAIPCDRSSNDANVECDKAPRPPTLGNILLSSCPGKKVRLNGATKAGRSAICRDLEADLARIKSLGVGCIICCLDDEEMEFLGAPWDAYLGYASCFGLDVLRLPMPEGLAPLDCAALNNHLTHIVDDYTLKGIHVLVHCRGGVGRAGLIACCWMLKLGMCGPIERAPPPTPGYVRRDALALVESAVRVVRVRRSLKAIETYEQVRFLIDFVEHLRLSAAM